MTILIYIAIFFFGERAIAFYVLFLSRIDHPDISNKKEAFYRNYSIIKIPRTLTTLAVTAAFKAGETGALSEQFVMIIAPASILLWFSSCLYDSLSAKKMALLQ